MSRRSGRIAILAAGLALAASAVSADPPGVTTYGRLLARYVRSDGVCYDAWRLVPADVAALSGLIRDWSTTDGSELTPPERTAQLINLYNAVVLEIVLANAPKRSITEVEPGATGFGVFHRPALRLAGKPMSLNDLEDRLRKDAKDPRIHFALNCAARSCPPLSPEPFRAATLAAQLDRCVRSFLAAPGTLQVTRPPAGAGVRIECSKLFDWYGEDFEAAGGILAFLRKYAPAAKASMIPQARGGAAIVFQDYDWSLNRAGSCGPEQGR